MNICKNTKENLGVHNPGTIFKKTTALAYFTILISYNFLLVIKLPILAKSYKLFVTVKMPIWAKYYKRFTTVNNCLYGPNLTSFF